MKLVLLLAADYANATGDGKLNVMGIFDAINSFDFPARQPSMHLVVKLAAELGENEETRNLTVKLLDADGNQVMNISSPVEVPKGGGGKRPEVNVVLALKDIIFPKPGPYEFVVMVDKDHKGDLALYANKVEPPDTSKE